MKNLISGVMILATASLSAATGQHIKRAVLMTRSGATVASAQADMNGLVRFTNVPPGDYRIVLTNADGRSVTLADLDGDGMEDIFIEGAHRVAPAVASDGRTAAPPAAAPGSGGGAGGGKVSVSSFNVMKEAPSASPVASPRDSASGMATGKRMHKPYCCVVDWSGSVKGGFTSEMDAASAGQRLPASSPGACAVRVVCDSQTSSIEVKSSSWDLKSSYDLKSMKK